jgi:hypothetical protein
MVRKTLKLVPTCSSVHDLQFIWDMASYTQYFALHSVQNGQLVFKYAATYQQYAVTEILTHEEELSITIRVHLLTSENVNTAGIITMSLRDGIQGQSWKIGRE